ncbi:hypothetical protein NXF25_015059 [Crotalus adamanteus]|uniref:Uncharacterized protein n=1 Tax=Crotalus adamanteus TaxID=8729 RepID=A0AAW1AXP8_CROAD
MMEITKNTENTDISEYAEKVQQHSPFLQNEQDCSAQGHPVIQPTQCLKAMVAVDTIQGLILMVCCPWCGKSFLKIKINKS